MVSIQSKNYKPYMPYIKEAKYCFLRDLLICFFGASFLLGLGLLNLKGGGKLLIVFPLFLLVECFINYRISLFAILEVNKGLYRKEQLRFIKSKTAPEFVGRWEPVLPKFYPQYRVVKKLILFFQREDGSIIKLRCIFFWSGGINRSKERPLEEVKYGRFSKVIISKCHWDRWNG